MSIHAKLAKVQRELHAPKNQTNKFGGYNYRSCEDILQAVKPLLGDSTIVVNDEIVEVAGRIYVKATATFGDGSEFVSATAYAREADQKKGMDPAQLTGATSSYARKYALNGLLLIDDNRDADSMDNRQSPPASMTDDRVNSAIKACEAADSRDKLTRIYQAARSEGATDEQLAKINAACANRVSQIKE